MMLSRIVFQTIYKVPIIYLSVFQVVGGSFFVFPCLGLSAQRLWILFRSLIISFVDILMGSVSSGL